MFGTYLLKWYFILKELLSINTRNVVWKYLPNHFKCWMILLYLQNITSCGPLSLFQNVLCLTCLHEPLLGRVSFFTSLFLSFFKTIFQFSHLIGKCLNSFGSTWCLYDRNNGIHFIWCQVENATLLPVMMNNLNMNNIYYTLCTNYGNPTNLKILIFWKNHA